MMYCHIRTNMRQGTSGPIVWVATGYTSSDWKQHSHVFDNCKMFQEVDFIAKKSDWNKNPEGSLTRDLEEMDIEILMLFQHLALLRDGRLDRRIMQLNI